MTNVIQPFHLLLFALAGWLNRHQQAVIDYLIEGNRVLKDQLDGQRLRFTDEQRIRLAVKAKALADERSMKSKRLSHQIRFLPGIANSSRKNGVWSKTNPYRDFNNLIPMVGARMLHHLNKLFIAQPYRVLLDY